MTAATGFGALLRAQQLAVALGDGRPCRPLSFACDRARVLCVRGPSGSGKSTLLRALLGLWPVEAGRLERLHADGGQVAAGERAVCHWRATAVASALQRDALFACLTADDHMDFAGADPARAEAVLAQLGLAHRRRARAGTLSHGEGRRLAVAMALSAARPLLVLDEPTEGLDAVSADAVWRAVAGAAERGAAILVASHDGRVPTDAFVDLAPASAPGAEPKP